MKYLTDKEVNEGFDKEFGHSETCHNQKLEDYFNDLSDYCYCQKKEIKSFISTLRKNDLEAIKKALIEQAEPYDNSKWHNTLSVETITKVLESLTSNHE
jgi:hypothetical protein